MSSEHTYFTQSMATPGLADGGVFNLQPTGCLVLSNLYMRRFIMGWKRLRGQRKESLEKS